MNTENRLHERLYPTGYPCYPSPKIFTQRCHTKQRETSYDRISGRRRMATSEKQNAAQPCEETVAICWQSPNGLRGVRRWTVAWATLTPNHGSL